MPNYSVFPPVTVAVTTNTEIFNTDAFLSKKTWVQVDNLDPSQTFSGTIQLRLDPALPWASSTFPDFSAIPPNGSVVAVLDTEQLNKVRMIGTMSGAGGNVRVTVKDVPK